MKNQQLNPAAFKLLLYFFLSLTPILLKAQPANDTPCDATMILPDGSCTSGTTIDATLDWSNPFCSDFGENSVWFSTTLSGANNALDINISNQNITGDISAMFGTFSPDCNGGFNFIEEYCGPADASISSSGLLHGATYWVVVSTENANAGDFEICIQEKGPPAACAVNDLCSGAIDISGIPTQRICVQGCNTGVGPDNTGAAGCFDFSSIPTVWYTFTTDATTANVTIDISSSDFDQPQMAIFEGPCPGTPVDCNLGTGGAVALNAIPVNPNTTYLIAAGSIGGQEGDFVICAFYNNPGTNCMTSGEVVATATSLGSPLSGPFKPDEVVNFCFNIDWISSGNNCQWLHGIVPSFGNGWDESSFDNMRMPLQVDTIPASFQWYEDSIVTYNDLPFGTFPPGSPVGAGWFSVGVNNNGNLPAQCGPNAWMTDPNCSFGIPMGCNSTNNFELCFDLTTKSFNDCTQNPSSVDCSIEFKSFGDGETGGWGSAGCEKDNAIFGNFSLVCCTAPEFAEGFTEACNEEQLNLFLEDYLLNSGIVGEVSYSWTATADSEVEGAGDCMGNCPPVISQILTNMSAVAKEVDYMVYPMSLAGCAGSPFGIKTMVNPALVTEVNIYVFPETNEMPDTIEICDFEEIRLSAFSEFGGSNWSFFWEFPDGSTSSDSVISVSQPGSYSIMLTHNISGCSGSSSVELRILPPDDVRCISVGTQNTVKTAIPFHPNPSSGLIHIQGLSPQMKLSIFDLQGKVVDFSRKKTGTENGEQVDLSFLPKGVYFLSIADDKKVETHKIIIQ